MAMTKEELMAQCFIVSTEEQYDKFVEERGIPQSKKKFPGGGSVLWLGSPSAKRVALYVHGGGLVMSATSFHMSFLKRIQEAAAGGDDESFAVAILAYQKCPDAPYPSQLSQLVELVVYLMANRATQDIDLCGDSVGATMILAALLHCQHPHPKVPELSIPKNQKFGRVLLISPGWIVATPTVKSSKNIGRDMIGLEHLQEMVDMVQASRDPDVDLVNPWFTPLSVLHEDWYRELPAGDILMVSGGREVFHEDTETLFQMLKRNHQGAVDRFVDEDAVHINFVVEGLTGIPPSEYTKRIMEWAKN